MAKKVRKSVPAASKGKKGKAATKDRPDLDDADERVGGGDVESEDGSDPEEMLSSEDEEEREQEEQDYDDVSLESDHGSDVSMTGGSDDETGEEATASLALDSGVDPALVLPAPPSTGAYINKQRCLVLCTRGVTSRHRHLLEDLRKLIPHMKKDSKLDDKQSPGTAVNEIATVKSCNSALFLEARKRSDVYLWMGLTPNGPSAKFHLTNIHTMDELKLTGNTLKSSRPLLNFSREFGTKPHWKVIKELLQTTFGTPRGHPKSQPFCDRVMNFAVVDNKVWVRNYQILEAAPSNAKEAREAKQNGGGVAECVEVGPRFVLDPMRIFSGSFRGQTLYQNGDFVSPNARRAEEERLRGKKYEGRKGQEGGRKRRREEIKGSVPRDDVRDVFRR